MRGDARQLVPRETLRRIAQRRDLPGLAFLGGHLATLLATGLLLQAAIGTAFFWPATFLHGLVVVHLFAPFHEASHYSVFRRHAWNDALAWLTGLAVILPPTHFRLEHREHHAHTQDPALDPEMITHTRSVAGMIWYATAIPYFKETVSELLRHPIGILTETERRFIPPSHRRRVVRDARIMWAVYALVAALSLWAGSTAALTFWLVPRIVGEPFMRVVRMAEHGAMPFVSSMLDNTRTVRTLRPLQWLAWNMAFHAEHHALPAVPFHGLPELHHHLRAHLADVRDGYVETQAHLVRQALADGP